MRDIGDHGSPMQSPDAPPNRKRLGGYLVEAGLLTPYQVDVALNDQKLTGMRFGEILAARGWVKQQTIEYLMKKVVLPEQKFTRQGQPRQPTSDAGMNRNQAIATPRPEPATSDTIRQTGSRRETPISKPLPSVSSSDGDVSWVG